METRIRIVKRGAGVSTSDVAPAAVEKTPRQSERDTANAVKSWIAEWEVRNRLVKQAAFSLLRSVQNGTESSTRRLAVVNR